MAPQDDAIISRSSQHHQQQVRLNRLLTSSLHSTSRKIEPIEKNASVHSFFGTTIESPKSPDSSASKPPRTRSRRLIALILGICALTIIGFGAHSFLQHHNVGLRRHRGIPEERFFSMADVHANRYPERCWIAIHDIVYDLTEYQHPGGNRIIHGKCGQDATKAFDAYHPIRYLSQITKFALGITKEETAATPAESQEVGGGTNATTSYSMSEGEANNVPERCWLVIHGTVYNVTEFEHPGGNRFIHGNCGRDATEAFDASHPLIYLQQIEVLALGRITDDNNIVIPIDSKSDLPVTLPTFSMSDVEANDVPGRCWLVLHGIVYDLTEYEHPGGDRIIHGKCGENATRAFDANHPLTYLSQIEDFMIGLIEEEATVDAPTFSPSRQLGIPEASLTPTTVPTAREFGNVAGEELGEHDSPLDCWLAIHGNVYDLTDYAPRHPGGSVLITEYCGQDATAMFNFHHSKSMLRVVESKLVGSFETAPTGHPSASPITLPPSTNPTVTYRSSMPISIQTEILDSTRLEPSLGVESNFTEELDRNATMSDETENSPTTTTYQVILDDLEQLVNTTSDSAPSGIEHNPSTPTIPSTPSPNLFVSASPMQTGLSSPSSMPSPVPTATPSQPPMMNPTDIPTDTPTNVPSHTPTASPSNKSQTEAPSTLIQSEPPSSCISLSQVSRHNTAEDCFMVLYNQVFDFTEYADIHPGGSSWITDYCGVDATVPFESVKKHDANLLSKKGGYSYLIANLCA